MLVMMVRGYALVALAMLGGCAQLFGLDETTAPATPTDGPNDAPIDGPPVDARVCAGGDARVTDPMTGNCYVLFTTPATRNTARTMCQTLGTGVRLASVQSAAENQVIANLIGATDAFLGGNDEAVENTFVWDDGTAVVLTNWNTGEPNNAAGMFEEDCIVMLGTVPGKWDDRPCAPGPVGTGSYAYVCER
jgi:hypothetical protein